MVYIYWIENLNRREPHVFRDGIVPYVHVKSKNCGTKTIAITKQPVEHERVHAKTQDEAQEILDSWISSENESPELDAEANPILQKNIDLQSHIKHAEEVL